MEILNLNPKQYPKLSNWEEEHLNETLEHLSKSANPSKKTISRSDKKWTAKMLEMDLQAQSGAIFEEQEKWEHPHLEHNQKMLKKMREQKIPWSDGYPE